MKIADGFVLSEVCPYCGKEQIHAKSVCNHCGKIMVVARESEIPYCKSCECKELRATKHALWLTRTMRADAMIKFFSLARMWNKVRQWQWVERKCREKAKEFE